MRKTLLSIAVCLAVGVPAPAAAAETGGAGAPGPPQIRRITCLSEPAAPCASARTLYRGRSFVVRGEGLSHAARIVLQGRRSRRDDAVARVVRRSERYAVASVPAQANSGRLMVIDRFGVRVRTRAVRIRRAPKAPPVDVAPGSRFFFDGVKRPQFTFDIQRATGARIELVSEESQAVVRSWDVTGSQGQPGTVSWDGRGASGVEKPGAYRFRVAGGASASNQRAFFFADHLFPIRGRHNLGYTDINNFGGGRNHKGQDLFARCGTRLAAARGGTVQFAGYHSAAGYYAVIDGADTGVDYVYMHMRAPALVSTGDRVFTGQKIGEIGETGRATGCHLHFEMWTAPGWYEGGRAFDPLPSLRVWDRDS